MKSALFFYHLALVPIVGLPILMFMWFWVGPWMIPNGQGLMWGFVMVLMALPIYPTIRFRRWVRIKSLPLELPELDRRFGHP